MLYGELRGSTGVVGYYTPQRLSGNGYFRRNPQNIGEAESYGCIYCKGVTDTAEHHLCVQQVVRQPEFGQESLGVSLLCKVDMCTILAGKVVRAHYHIIGRHYSEVDSYC